MIENVLKWRSFIYEDVMCKGFVYRVGMGIITGYIY